MVYSPRVDCYGHQMVCLPRAIASESMIKFFFSVNYCCILGILEYPRLGIKHPWAFLYRSRIAAKMAYAIAVQP